MSDLPKEPSIDGVAVKTGFDSSMQGRVAECDGGRPLEGTHFASRQFFAGKLSGDYRDYGDYPWRWFLMHELTQKPENYPYDAVWCDEGSLVLMD